MSVNKSFLILTIILLTFLPSKAQFINNYGLSLNGSITNTYVKNPLKPENGTFSYGNMKSLGFGFFVNHKLTERILVESRLSYQTKGFNSIKQTFSGSETDSHKFRYITLDGIIKPRFKKVYLLGGIGLSMKASTYYAKQDIYAIDIITGEGIYEGTVDIVEIDNPHANEKIRLDKFKDINANLLLGIGLSINSLVDTEILTSYDLSPSYESTDTTLKYLNWTFRVSFNIGSLLSSSKE